MYTRPNTNSNYPEFAPLTLSIKNCENQISWKDETGLIIGSGETLTKVFTKSDLGKDGEGKDKTYTVSCFFNNAPVTKTITVKVSCSDPSYYYASSNTGGGTSSWGGSTFPTFGSSEVVKATDDQVSCPKKEVNYIPKTPSGDKEVCDSFKGLGLDNEAYYVAIKTETAPFFTNISCPDGNISWRNPQNGGIYTGTNPSLPAIDRMTKYVVTCERKGKQCIKEVIIIPICSGTMTANIDAVTKNLIVKGCPNWTFDKDKTILYKKMDGKTWNQKDDKISDLYEIDCRNTLCQGTSLCKVTIGNGLQINNIPFPSNGARLTGAAGQAPCPQKSQDIAKQFLENLLCGDLVSPYEVLNNPANARAYLESLLAASQNASMQTLGIYFPSITQQMVDDLAAGKCQAVISQFTDGISGSINLADPDVFNAFFDAFDETLKKTDPLACDVSSLSFSSTLSKSMLADAEYDTFAKEVLLKDYIACLEKLHGSIKKKTIEIVSEEIIRYMINEYGWDNCYQIIKQNPSIWDRFKSVAQKASEALQKYDKIDALIDWKKYTEKEVEEIAKTMLIDKAEGMYKGVSTLTQEQKGQFFRTDSKATMAILLYEFATGTGQETTHFDETVYGSFAIVEELKKMDFIKEAEARFYSDNDNGFYGKLQTVRFPYEFSPTGNHLRLFNLPNSIPEHIKACNEIYNQDNYLRLFLGGTVVTMDADDEKGGDKIVFTVADNKTRNSLFLHANQFSKIAVNVPRSEGNIPLSTTKQRYIFTIKLDITKFR